MAITFRQLQYFLVLSEELHFGRAAQRLAISQPPLSTSMQNLEATLGFKLLERANKSVRLTPAGAVYADHVRQILSQLSIAQNSAGQTARGATGNVVAGFVPSMLYRRLPQLLKAFQRQYPDIVLKIQEMNSSSQIEMLMKQKIDVGFIHAVPLPDMIASCTLEEERLVCCIPRGHRLARRTRIALKDLGGEEVLVFSRDFAAYYYDHIHEMLAKANIQPTDKYRIQHWFTIIALVANGMGVSIVPRSLGYSHHQDVVYLELEDNEAKHAVSLIWRKQENNNATKAFISNIRKNYAGTLP